MQPRIINFGRWFPKFCKILSLQAVDQLLKSISVPRTESVNIKCSSLLQRREGVFRKIYILWIFWYLRWFTSWWRGNNLHSELVKCFSKNLIYFVLIWFSSHCLTLCHLINCIQRVEACHQTCSTSDFKWIELSFWPFYM